MIFEKELYSTKLENKNFEGIYYSVFIASWNKANTGRYKHHIEMRAFRQWLKTITVNDKHLPDDIIQEIVIMKDDGKFELEEYAKVFEYDPSKDGKKYIGDE